MAFRSQLFGVPLPQLESVEKVQEKLKENKLVLILFNTNYPKEHSIESKFKSWGTTYESKNDLHIYKCVISVLENPLKKEYQIKKLPTFIFFQNGQPIGRLEDAENIVPPVNNVEEVNPNTETLTNNAEEQLKHWLDSLCSEAEKTELNQSKT